MSAIVTDEMVDAIYGKFYTDARFSCPGGTDECMGPDKAGFRVLLETALACQPNDDSADEINRLRSRLRKIEAEARAVISEWKYGFDSNRLPSALRDLEAELTETA